jgi:uncharacterized protein YjaZ
MAIRFHVMEANGVLVGPLRERLDAALSRADRICSEKLKLADIDIMVINAPRNVIPRIGVNGYAYDAHQILLSLDHAHPHLKQNFDCEIVSLVAHELHHSARSLARGSSHGGTYGGSLVAEGLACCFEEEVGEPTPFYAVECKGDALRKFSDKAKAEIDTKHGRLPGHWGDWMFGRAPNDPEFPYQCGYSTGYAVVRAWIATTGETASSAVAVDESVVLEAWTSGRIRPFG